jgi:hypothetical protein
MCRAGKEASERLSPARETSGAAPVIQSKGSDDNAAHIYEAEGFYGSLISLRSQGAIYLNTQRSRNYPLHRLIQYLLVLTNHIFLQNKNRPTDNHQQKEQTNRKPNKRDSRYADLRGFIRAQAVKPKEQSVA